MSKRALSSAVDSRSKRKRDSVDQGQSQPNENVGKLLKRFTLNIMFYKNVKPSKK